jgi:serine/threonine protein kinase
VSIASELERWAALLDRGLITREEFDQEKRILMANATNASNPSLGGGSQPGIGKSLGAYNILGMVGSGGMGVVYRARHRSAQIAKRQGGDVALKVLHAQYSQDPVFQERFEREATLGLKLNHPGIVKVHDLIVAEGGRLALAMELVKGQELSDLIGKVRGPIPWREALAMFDGLLDAVSHAHSEGVVHRDLKPENVMLCEGGVLKVLDFGIARDESSGKTKTGTGMGTVDYMAPEQYTDASKVDARADIYALGITLYEMVSGRLPWAANATEFEVLTTKADGQVPPPTQFYPDIPPELVTVIAQAMDVNLSRRCQSADAFRSALQEVGRRTDTAAKKTHKEETRKAREVATPKRASTDVAQQAAPVVLGDDKSSAWPLISFLALIIIGGIGFSFLSVDADEEPIPTSERKAETVKPIVPELDDKVKVRNRLPSSAFPASGADSSLIVATGTQFLPMYDLTSSSPTGFEVDLAREIASQLGRVAVFRKSSSARLKAKSGDADMAIQAISITPERRKSHLFSDPYFQNEYVVVKKRGGHASGISCSVGPNKLYRGLLKDWGCDLRNYKANTTAIKAVKQGEVTYSITERTHLSTEPTLEVVASLGSVPYGIVFLKGNYVLQQRVNEILAEMRADGTYDSLTDRYGL